MKNSGKNALLALLLILLPGCAPQKVKAKVPVAAQAPTTSDQTGAMYPPPFPEKTEAPPAPAPEMKQADQTLTPEPQPPEKPSKKKKSVNASKGKPSAAKPVATGEVGAAATAPTPAAPVQRAANVEPAVVSPIGQLSSGEGAASSQQRHETSDLIANTEQGLNGIKRTLSSQEQETVTQIRTYLKQAKKALTVDDLDGATTLATKAKVLLEELTKP
jgi:hypothetical protein